LHQYHPVKPLPFLFTSRFDSIFVQPVATLSIKLASGRNRFWSTNFRMQACSGAIKPYYFVFPQHVSCCCQSKFSFVLLWLSLLCDSFSERQAHFSSIRPSGRMPCFFCTRTSRRLRRGCLWTLRNFSCLLFSVQIAYVARHVISFFIRFGL